MNVARPAHSTRLHAVVVLVSGIAWLSLVAGTAAQQGRPAGWTEASHGSAADPDYARLFSLDTVHELRITIPAESFRAMQEDLSTIGPAFGRGGPPGAGPGFGPPGAGGGPPAAGGPRGFGRGGGMPGRGGAIQLTSRDPIYVAVTVEHGGRTWPHVGLRYKGNSSLISAAASNNGKIPFRLDFDRYEDDHPETRNQRFYGFDKLTFSSNFGDDSQMREVIAVEIFRDRGVPAARAAFYRVLVDVGEGFEYWGLYAMIEDPSDVMLKAQFGSADGNLYKPDGPNWTEFHEDGFPKKTNQREGDFSDVEAAIAALHAPQTDARAWREAFEATFDADGFLRWLAVNTAIQNWDVYGAMAHNYYLYGDPAQNGRLRWIPWDHNFALGASPGGPGGPGGRGFPGAPPAPAGLPAGRGLPPGAALPGPGGAPFGMGRGMMFGNSTDVLHTQVGEQWPLIQRLLADDVYAARYRDHLADALDGLYSLETIEGRLRELHALIAPFVAGDQGERPTHTTISAPGAFETSIEGPNGLIAFIRTRHQTIRTALGGASNR